MLFYLLLALVAAFAFALLVTRHRSRSRSRSHSSAVSGIDALMQWSAEQRLQRWRDCVLEDQGPTQPTGGYTLLAANKRADEHGVHFECRWQRWDNLAQTSNGSGAWRPADSKRLQDLAVLLEQSPAAETHPADTPVDQLAELWADFCLRIGRINEAIYTDWQQREQEQDEERAEYIGQIKERFARRQAAQEAADLLPRIGDNPEGWESRPQAGRHQTR